MRTQHVQPHFGAALTSRRSQKNSISQSNLLTPVQLVTKGDQTKAVREPKPVHADIAATRRQRREPSLQRERPHPTDRGVVSRDVAEDRGSTEHPALPLFSTPLQERGGPEAHEIGSPEPQVAINGRSETSSTEGSQSQTCPDHLNFRRPVIVSAEFRAELFRLLPGLHKDPGHIRFLEHLMFSESRDPGTDRLKLCREIVASFYGKNPVLCGGNYTAKHDIERFIEDVLPSLVVIPYDYELRKCRRVDERSLPRDVLEALDRELASSDFLKDAVFLDTGAAVSRKRLRELRRETLYQTQERTPTSEEQARLLSYLHSVPPNTFTLLLGRNYAHAVSLAESIEDPEQRRRELRKLRQIKTLPRPTYGPTTSGRTHRVFEVRDGVTQLKTDVRRALTRGDVELDLKSAQLAINAKLWGVSEALDFLLSGADIWEDIALNLGLEEAWRKPEARRDIKDALKKATYAVLYGAKVASIYYGHRSATGDMKEPGLRQRLEAYGVENLKERFMSHPVIAAMYAARERQIAEILDNGGARDVFGKWHPATDRGQAKSVLAALAQAVELQLLLPALELAERSRDDFYIVAWQHDGFTVHPRRNGEKKQRALRRIVEAVNANAGALGYPTRLEPKHL